jgi:hypothetical protein
MIAQEIAGQGSQWFRELYAAALEASSESDLWVVPGKLTQPVNCGKLVVYTARFLRCVCRSFESSRPAENRTGNSHPARHRENW